MTHEFLNSRRTQLLDILRENGHTDVSTLVKSLESSEATVRRDLAKLEAAGLLTRTFGGAVLKENQSLVARTFEQKRERMRQAKEHIAARAAEMVEPGMTIALDSGTTAWRIATALKNSGPLTILSSALAPVEELGPVAGMEVHSTGGRFRLENLDFVGPRAIAMCAGFHVDLAFLGADAFAPGTGAFTTDEWSAAIADALARIAERVVLVVDSSKFGNTARFRVLSVDRIATVLTDSGILREMQAAMAADPYDLIVAAPAREL